MKHIGKIASLLLVCLLLLTLLCSCSSGAEYGLANKGGDGNRSEYYDDVEAAPEKPAGASKSVTDSRKIVEYVHFSVETKTFDKLLSDVSATVAQVGGYIENSSIDGNRYYQSDCREAELTIRIPKDKQADFSDFIAKNSNVVSRSVNTEDVTDQYIDTQSRIKALTIEKETLEGLLTKATDLSETMTVYERLTDVIAELESYQSRLNQMDNLVEYTTFTVYISEGEKETPVEKQSWFTTTWNGFVDNLSDLGNGLLTGVSYVLSTAPYWLLFVAVPLVVLLLVLRHHRKKRAKQTAKPTDNE